MATGVKPVRPREYRLLKNTNVSPVRILPPHLAIACPPNGSRTTPPGSRGRTIVRLAGQVRAHSWVYAEIVRHLSHVERVNILVNSEAAEERAPKFLQRAHVLSAGRANRSACPQHPIPPLAYQPRLDAGLGPIFVKSARSALEDTRARLALQRVGEISRLAA